MATATAVNAIQIMTSILVTFNRLRLCHMPTFQPNTLRDIVKGPFPLPRPVLLTFPAPIADISARTYGLDQASAQAFMDVAVLWAFHTFSFSASSSTSCQFGIEQASLQIQSMDSCHFIGYISVAR